MLEYARHEAQLNALDDKGSSVRSHYEARAKQGSQEAIEMLEGKPFPVDLEYLYTWSMSLVGRSGAGMGGLYPLSHTEIEAWSRVSGNCPSPEEVDALIALDAVLRHPDTEVKKPEPEEVKKPTFVAAWPSRKNKMAD